MLAPLAQSPIASEAVVKEEDQPFTLMELFPKFFSTATPGGYMGRYAAESAITDEPGKILHDMSDHFRTARSPICHVIASYGLNLQLRAGEIDLGEKELSLLRTLRNQAVMAFKQSS